MSAITLLDGSLKLSIYYDTGDNAFADAICLRFIEDCPDDERLLRANETGIYLTPEEAALIVLDLTRAIQVAHLYSSDH